MFMTQTGTSILITSVRLVPIRLVIAILKLMMRSRNSYRRALLFPFIEKLRFFKTGSDACSAAVRIARAYTRNSRVVSNGYHGWSDLFTSLTSPALGVVDQFCIVDRDYIERADAAYIMEPVEIDFSDKRKEWLKKTKEKCVKYGTVLIFDEIITGGRFPKMCVSQYWDIKPDLICLGKGLAGGMPISIVGGKKEIMDCGEWFCSGTFNGETLSLAAMDTTLDILSKQDMSLLWECGQRFIDKFNALTPDVQLTGYPTRCVWDGVAGLDVDKRGMLWQEAAKAGILFGKAWFFNWELIPHTDFTIEICREIFDRIDRHDVVMEGPLPGESFKR
jgi:glutamate-1-semialdehyde 2,1-aminomutase